MRHLKYSLLTITLIAIVIYQEWPREEVTQASQSSGLKTRDYKTARTLFWKKIYSRHAVSLYCGEKIPSPHGKGYNVEHIFPMSWVTKALHCGTRKQCRKTSVMFNKIEADMHNLYPTRSDTNADRSSFRFGEIAGEARRYGSQCDFEVDQHKRIAEPRPEVRGEVARAMFYMARQYQSEGLKIFPRQAKLLTGWHNADPPDDAERQRNFLINKLQGNANPFIEKPENLDFLLKNGFFETTNLGN